MSAIFERVVYTVTVTFADERVADEWLRWLCPEHVNAVLAAGALDAEVVAVDTDGPGRTLEVRYHFAARDDFARYEREHAPRLRAEGLQRFPPERGITYRRALGVATATFRRPHG
jgi:hypothetical protein